ncbi:hypothetical protein HMPREF9069_00863 [Atopobium sp. oral taxon 810 str. F0209]|nr:hypothetical protein HMPREF9069_01108 [Atopobium sp. oral taxon 810 str. F0209]ERI05429.1 hypothetical protein HMPREF9069_00863 [Atopobium sp. oral taxon 810 str. F0209]
MFWHSAHWLCVSHADLACVFQEGKVYVLAWGFMPKSRLRE